MKLHKHAVRLRDSIGRHTGDAADFAAALPLAESASDAKRAQWAREVCAYLEDRFTPDEIQAIRRDCSCDPGGKADKVKVLYEKSVDNADFCDKFNAAYAPGNVLSRDGDALLLTYPTCYCSCVKRGDEKLTAAWCACSLGYAEKLFARALGRVVRVELLESVLTGGRQCVMKIT